MRYDGQEFTLITTEDGLPHNTVTSILEDRQGHLWFGTWGGGVSRYDGKAFTTFTNQNSQLINKQVYTMLEDRDGNLWASDGWAGPGTNGVQCLTPEGELIGRIHLPEPCSNLCFGGVKKNRLFMTGGQSLYALYVEAIGSQSP